MCYGERRQIGKAHGHGEARQHAGKERGVPLVVSLVKGVVLSAPDGARCVPFHRFLLPFLYTIHLIGSARG